MSSEPPEPKGKMRIVYSKDFLLALGETDRCKKLPPGFDASLLSDLQEVSAGVLDRSKGHYGTPLGRSDGSGSYSYSSRGGNSGGRWETRSSGSSDRDGDLTDRESLTQDRRNGNQYKRNWQTTEHDGLLGSGSFPRPPGYSGNLASKDRGNAYQPNRTSERYQPPRPYKAAPFTRKDIDSMNDETFGSFECSNEDRAEEEKKRRASFELMRKEQHKVLLEKKNGPDIEKENPGNDIVSLLQNTSEKTGATSKSEKPDGFLVSSVCQEDTTKISSVLPAPAARPLVPPGFSSAFVEKKLQPPPPNISLEPKAHNATDEDNMLTVERFGQVEGSQLTTETTASKNKEKDISDNIATVGQKHTVPSVVVTSSTEFTSNIFKGGVDCNSDAMDKYSIEKQGLLKNIDSVRKDNSISILEQFFGNALLKSGSNLPAHAESEQMKTDDNMVTSVPESSKFARWFLDEDLKPAEDSSSKSLFSMIVKNENPGPESIAPGAPLSDGAIQNLSPRSHVDNFDAASKLLSFSSPLPGSGILEQYSHADIPQAVPVMMTCEDLEQTMLAQVAGSSSTNQKSAAQGHQAVLDEPTTVQKAAVDNHASQHILSLLQKGSDNMGSSSMGFRIGSADEPQSSDVNVMVNGGTSGTAQAEAVPTSGKSLTLEALFGTAFMNELHSKDAPVSIRGSATGGSNYEFAETGKTLLPSGQERYFPGEQALPYNNIKDGVALKETGNGVEYRSSAFPGPGPSQVSASFDKKGLEIQLPEEDNLFTMNDSLDARKPDIFPSVKSGRIEGLLPEKTLDDLNYRFQNLVPGDAEHVQVLGPDALGSHSHDHRYQVESQNLYHLLQGRPPTLAPRPMMDHIGNRNQPAPFDIPQAIHHDPHRSFPANMHHGQHVLHHAGVPHMDPAAHHLMLQHISMPGSFPPEGLPRGVPPSQPAHHMPGYRPEMSNVNSFPMHPRQPNYGELGMMMPGPSGAEVRGNQPEAFERLMQMELAARTKQIHPAMAELDMNLRYR